MSGLYVSNRFVDSKYQKEKSARWQFYRFLFPCERFPRWKVYKSTERSFYIEKRSQKKKPASLQNPTHSALRSGSKNTNKSRYGFNRSLDWKIEISTKMNRGFPKIIIRRRTRHYGFVHFFKMSSERPPGATRLANERVRLHTYRSRTDESLY